MFCRSSSAWLISLQEAKLSGCRNILALRGDPPAGKDDWEAVEGGFEHGVDLVRYIRKEYGDYFDIAVAGYPQTHMLPPEERAQELIYLKEKVDAGADFIFTQMFYDADMFIDWVHAIRDVGINVPVVPGIMPIQTWNGFLRAATAIAKTIIPQAYLDALEPYKNNDEKVRDIGTKLVADMCRKILAAPIGIQGLHFYTMNLERGSRMLLEEMNLVPRVETLKPLPWRQVRFMFSLLSFYLTCGCSLSLPRGGQKPFAQSFGRIVQSLTSPGQKTGTSIPMVDLGTRVVPPMENWMGTASHSNKRYVTFTCHNAHT